MKNLLLIIVLALIVVAVSYYKTMLQGEQYAAEYNRGQADAAENLQLSEQEIDTLRAQLSTNQAKLAEAELLADTIRLCQTDSLREVVAQNELAIADLTAKTQANGKNQASKTKTKVTNSRHTEILAHYKKLYKSLPLDLTAYERRVALAEIRDKSTRKFSITLAELNKIRKAAKLNY